MVDGETEKCRTDRHKLDCGSKISLAHRLSHEAGLSCFNDYANGLITEREYRRYILAA